MKINNRIETIFAQAAALGNCGRFKSSIYCIKNNVYLLNSDNTVILKFPLRKNESVFTSSISFSSSDYDSRDFYEKEGKIVFRSSNEKYERRKTCGGINDIEIEKIYNSFPPNLKNRVGIDKSITSLLEDSLSHIEFGIKANSFYLIQRDIYSGTIIEISEIQSNGIGLIDSKLNIKEYGPIGLRTNDFLALFAFQPSISLGFEEDKEYGSIKGNNELFPMNGIIAHCIYDELGIIEEVNNGRKEQENRSSKSKVNSEVNESKSIQGKRKCIRRK